MERAFENEFGSRREERVGWEVRRRRKREKKGSLEVLLLEARVYGDADQQGRSERDCCYFRDFGSGAPSSHKLRCEGRGRGRERDVERETRRVDFEKCRLFLDSVAAEVNTTLFEEDS